MNYWILGIISFLGISCSYLVLEKIPNPIKNYKTTSGKKLNYFELYDIKMKDFVDNETLALDIQYQNTSQKEDMLNYIENHTMYYWNENLKIVNEIENYSIPKDALKKNVLLKQYVLLRIKQTGLIRQKIESESDKFDQKLIEVNQEINNIIFTVTN